MRAIAIFVLFVLSAACAACCFFFFKYPDCVFSEHLREMRFKCAAEEAAERIEDCLDDIAFLERFFDDDDDDDDDDGDKDKKPVQPPPATKTSSSLSADEQANKTEAKVEPAAFPPKLRLEGDWYVMREGYCSGPRLSSAALKDAVVLVYVWNCDNMETASLMSAVEDIWKSFNHKNFKVVASNRGSKSAKNCKALKKCSFSSYDYFSYRKEPSVSELPCLYVVTSSGKVVNCARNHRIATQVIVTAFAEQYERQKSKR